MLLQIVNFLRKSYFIGTEKDRFFFGIHHFYVTLFASQTAAFIDDTKTKTRQAIHEAQRENEAQLNNAKLRFGHNHDKKYFEITIMWRSV